MNLILLYEKDFIESNLKVRLLGRRYKHIREVLRSSLGEVLCVGLLNGKIGFGKIIGINENHIDLEVKFSIEPPQPHQATLILALPRPIVLKRILLAVSSLGVKKIILIHSKRVEKSFWKSPVLEEKKLREQLIFGLEQSKDTMLPEILVRKRFKPFVEDELPKLIKGSTAIVGHPSAGNSFPQNLKNKVILIVGPEGGFIDYEVEMLHKCGVQAVSVGERILRVETAVPVLLAKVM